MKLRQIVILLCLFAYLMMPAMAATGEDGVTIIKKDGSDSNIEKKDSSEEEDSIWDVNTTNSEGFNKLFMAPVTAVGYLMNVPPIETTVLILLGIVFGGSFVLTLLSLATNNGRVATGGILNKLKMMTTGKDNMIWVIGAFAGFLFAIALLKFLGSTSIF